MLFAPFIPFRIAFTHDYYVKQVKRRARGTLRQYLILIHLQNNLMCVLLYLSIHPIPNQQRLASCLVRALSLASYQSLWIGSTWSSAPLHPIRVILLEKRNVIVVYFCFFSVCMCCALDDLADALRVRSFVFSPS